MSLFAGYECVQTRMVLLAGARATYLTCFTRSLQTLFFRRISCPKAAYFLESDIAL